MGSISVTRTRAPYERRDSAHLNDNHQRQQSENKESTTHSLPDITITGDNSDLTGKHDISGTLDTINKGFPASIVVVELGLRDGVVDIDGWDLQPAFPEGLVQVVDTRSSLLRKTFDVLRYSDKVSGMPLYIDLHKNPYPSSIGGIFRGQGW
jgi:hypothetical protein